ncbi:hypothetical protein J31TS6_40840 [Brevibacillus reuszeri]|uniref:hypothetical protein n=1 Tax=Brevibacillus reuszeri TaxID=54915 RepID=UPI001B190D9D|nr:hypothetical protein [Brevibacillus reuszeri]GIO08056.1 hypothetical protein J31TS6_40840 [Brevibacillus reuszeri]
MKKNHRTRFLKFNQAYLVPIFVDKQFTVVSKRVTGVKYSIDRLQLNDGWVIQ